MERFPDVVTVRPDDFQRELQPWVRQRRVPVSVHFELTYRCNFDCVHCYVVQPHTRGELSTDEVLEALAQLQELGALYLTFSGGEALTRPDFARLYIRAKELGFLVTVMTNAALVKDRELALFRDYPPYKVEVTLYGAVEPTYQAVTRRQGMHALVLERVDRLLELGLRVILKTVALTVNHTEVDAIRDEARRRGCDDEFRFDAQITPRIDCRRGPEGYRIGVEALVDQDRRTPGRADELRGLYLRTRDLPSGGDKLFRCGAGRDSFVIDPDGKVQACVLYRREGGDLRREPLRDIWERTLLDVVEQPTTRPSRCHTCDKHVVCGSCPGNNALESGGDPEEPSDYLCEIAHARVAAFCGDLAPQVPPPAGRELPLWRARECQRPWLAVRRPLSPSLRTVPRRAASAAPRRLPVVSSPC